MYEKDFDAWNSLKKKLDAENAVPYFHEGEVWWTSLGINIGHEENGKNARFNRPVLIVRKFNKHLFWGVPLTTQVKENKHYYQFHFGDIVQCAMLTQLRLWDATRLTSYKGKVAKKDLMNIKERLAEYLK